MAGAGLDSRAVELVNWELKKRIGFFSYAVAALQAFAETLPLIEVSNGRETASGQMILIGNGKFYGGRFTVFPPARLFSGSLATALFPRLYRTTIPRAPSATGARDLH